MAAANAIVASSTRMRPPSRTGVRAPASHVTTAKPLGHMEVRSHERAASACRPAHFADPNTVLGVTSSLTGYRRCVCARLKFASVASSRPKMPATRSPNANRDRVAAMQRFRALPPQADSRCAWLPAPLTSSVLPSKDLHRYCSRAAPKSRTCLPVRIPRLCTTWCSSKNTAKG